MSFPTTLPGTPAPVLMWADEHEIEPAARDQLRRIADLPWVHGVRVMPDVHLGKGATVGSVIAMRQAVSPSAVGVDIGCGMSAVRTSLTERDLPDDLGPLRSAIEAAVPVGFASHRDAAPILKRDKGLRDAHAEQMNAFAGLRARKVADRERKAHAQAGTLGGGNHFIEVTSDGSGRIWLMLHSGSRGIGNELAQRHIEEAKGLEHNLGLPDRDLAYLTEGTPEFDAYLEALHWAQRYAYLNREEMMDRVVDCLAEVVSEPVRRLEEINCHHNYTVRETPFGREVWLSRKGAIDAHEGVLGLIPGSMGDRS